MKSILEVSPITVFRIFSASSARLFRNTLTIVVLLSSANPSVHAGFFPTPPKRLAPIQGKTPEKKTVICGVSLDSNSFTSERYVPASDGYLAVELNPKFLPYTLSAEVLTGWHIDGNEKVACQSDQLPGRITGKILMPVRKDTLYVIVASFATKVRPFPNEKSFATVFFPNGSQIPREYGNDYFVKHVSAKHYEEKGITQFSVWARSLTFANEVNSGELQTQYTYIVFKGRERVGIFKVPRFEIADSVVQNTPGSWMVLVEKIQTPKDKNPPQDATNGVWILTYPKVHDR